MSRIALFFNRILVFLGLGRKSGPRPIPDVLDAGSLAQALSEARYLVQAHQVEVRDLLPGEEPSAPQFAGDVLSDDPVQEQAPKS